MALSTQMSLSDDKFISSTGLCSPQDQGLQLSSLPLSIAQHKAGAELVLLTCRLYLIPPWVPIPSASPVKEPGKI